MSKQTVPSEIQKLIDQENSRRAQEAADKAELAQIKFRKQVEDGTQLFGIWLQERLDEAPKSIRKYYVSEVTDELLANIGRDERVSQKEIRFHVPGLAPIFFGDISPSDGMWSCATAGFGSGGTVEFRSYFNARHFSFDYNEILIQACESQIEFDRLVAETIEREQEENQRFEHAQETYTNLKKDAAEAEQNELAKIAKIIKSDDALKYLVMAMVAIQQERGLFSAQIAEAESSWHTQEERWSRKAEQLRKQADDAERLAQAERARASEIENDLSDALRLVNKAD